MIEIMTAHVFVFTEVPSLTSQQHELLSAAGGRRQLYGLRLSLVFSGSAMAAWRMGLGASLGRACALCGAAPAARLARSGAERGKSGRGRAEPRLGGVRACVQRPAGPPRAAAGARRAVRW